MLQWTLDDLNKVFIDRSELQKALILHFGGAFLASSLFCIKATCFGRRGTRKLVLRGLDTEQTASSLKHLCQNAQSSKLCTSRLRIVPETDFVNSAFLA